MPGAAQVSSPPCSTPASPPSPCKEPIPGSQSSQTLLSTKPLEGADPREEIRPPRPTQPPRPTRPGANASPTEQSEPEETRGLCRWKQSKCQGRLAYRDTGRVWQRLPGEMSKGCCATLTKNKDFPIVLELRHHSGQKQSRACFLNREEMGPSTPRAIP